MTRIRTRRSPRTGSGGRRMIGIYSATAAEKHGSSIYLRPDGSEVEVTCVCDDADFDYRWPDKVIIGEVTKWLRTGVPTDEGHFGALRDYR